MTKEEIIKPENLVYKKPTLMNDNPMHYCPGCSHGAVSYTHLDVYKRQLYMLWFTHKELSLQILNKIARINRLTNSIQIIILF